MFTVRNFHLLHEYVLWFEKKTAFFTWSAGCCLPGLPFTQASSDAHWYANFLNLKFNVAVAIYFPCWFYFLFFCAFHENCFYHLHIMNSEPVQCLIAVAASLHAVSWVFTLNQQHYTEPLTFCCHPLVGFVNQFYWLGEEGVKKCTKQTCTCAT